MKVSQAIQYWTGYHKLHSGKKYPQSLPAYHFQIRPTVWRTRIVIYHVGQHLLENEVVFRFGFQEKCLDLFGHPVFLRIGLLPSQNPSDGNDRGAESCFPFEVPGGTSFLFPAVESYHHHGNIIRLGRILRELSDLLRHSGDDFFRGIPLQEG